VRVFDRTRTVGVAPSAVAEKRVVPGKGSTRVNPSSTLGSPVLGSRTRRFRFRSNHRSFRLTSRRWPAVRHPWARRGPLPTGRPLMGAAPPARLLRIGYHQPCHLKAQQIGNPGLELLREIPGVEVVDLAAGCCGMAGTFGMKASTYDLSMLTGKPLFDRIAGVSADLVASECSTCRLQIAQGTGLAVIHPIVLLAEAYGLGG